MDKNEILDIIEKKTSSLTQLGTALNRITNKVEPFDLFYISVVNRTVNLNTGFIELMRNNNFISAAPLVRINLDSVLRMYASTKSVYDRNKFASRVLDGEQINRMKAKDAKKRQLSDRFLVDEISKVDKMNWIKKIYEAGNSFVHFSDNLIYSSLQIENEEERTLSLTIGADDNFIDDDTKINICIWMNEISDAVVIQCKLWLYEKCQKYNFNYEDLNNLTSND